jgi:hypothetical protein
MILISVIFNNLENMDLKKKNTQNIDLILIKNHFFLFQNVLKLYSQHHPFCVIFLISPVEIQVNCSFNYGSKEKSSS